MKGKFVKDEGCGLRMDSKISVLVVENDLTFLKAVVEKIGKQQDMEVVGSTNDGAQALKEIIEKKPDVIILGLIIKQKDGISLIEEIKNNELITKKPGVIVASSIGSDNIISNLLSMGILYYFIKPFDIDLLPKRIRLLIKHEVETYNFFNDNVLNWENYDNTFMSDIHNTHESFINNLSQEEYLGMLLDKIMICKHSVNYSFIKDAILKYILNDNTVISITRDVYPALAEKNNTTSEKVERIIRETIHKCWNKKNNNFIYSLFSYKDLSKGEVPTNSEFIATLADYIKLNYTYNDRELITSTK